jgi:hypothetical protein
MRLTGALMLLAAVCLLVYALRTGEVPTSYSLLVATPLVGAGCLAAAWAEKWREQCLVLIVCAVFLTAALAATFGAERVARRESVRDLLRAASARGYGSAPVYNMYTVEHSADFYAAGRVVYDSTGDPVIFDGPGRALDVLRQRAVPAILVIIPSNEIGYLTRLPVLDIEIIGDNGSVKLVAVRLKEAPAQNNAATN